MGVTNLLLPYSELSKTGFGVELLPLVDELRSFKWKNFRRKRFSLIAGPGGQMESGRLWSRGAATLPYPMPMVRTLTFEKSFSGVVATPRPEEQRPCGRDQGSSPGRA